jgi:hypothetical protein
MRRNQARMRRHFLARSGGYVNRPLARREGGIKQRK